MRTMSLHVTLMTLGLLGAFMIGPAAAAGIAVAPPPDFTAKQIAKDGSYATEYELQSTADADAGCQVGFQPTQRSGTVTQAELNAAAAKPGFVDVVTNSLSPQYDALQVSPFESHGIQGVVAVGDIKAAKGAVRSLIVILEAPEGRANVACVANRAQFDALRPGFEAVARGVTVTR